MIKKAFCKRNHEQTEENSYYWFDKKKNKQTRSCKLCRLESNKEYDSLNKEKKIDQRYQRVYGISLEEVRTMAIQQDNKCAVCRIDCQLEQATRGNPKSFALDHCHSTGQVRGLLCHRCNKVLGLAKDDIELLFALIDYLKQQ